MDFTVILKQIFQTTSKSTQKIAPSASKNLISLKFSQFLANQL